MRKTTKPKTYGYRLGNRRPDGMFWNACRSILSTRKFSSNQSRDGRRMTLPVKTAFPLPPSDR